MLDEWTQRLPLNTRMTTHTQTSRLSKAGRWLAITAVTVLLFGKLVHLGQECGGCCSSSHGHASAQESARSEQECPFGCDHHSQNGPNEPCSSESPNDHDEHGCAVCSLLSQVTESPDLVGLPGESELVAASVCLSAAFAAADVFSPVHPRGPPSLV